MSDEVRRKDQEKWSPDQYTKLICCCCHWPLYPPVQLECCGQRICADCITITKNTDFRCPNCNTFCSNVAPDKGFLREVENLNVPCLVCGDSGIGPFKDLKVHLKSHCTIKCKCCDEVFIFQIQLEAHRRNRCIYRVAPCPLAPLGCSNEVPQSDIGKHYLDPDHQRYLLLFIKQILPSLHQATSSTASVNLNTEEDRHILVEYVQRVESTLQEINPVNNDCDELDLKRQRLEAKIIEMRGELRRLNEGSVISTKDIESVNEIFLELIKVISTIRSKRVTGPNLMDTNDTYTWKIDASIFSIDQSRTVHSDAFQSSRWGYKMGISMTVQMDKQSYIAVAIGIFRGDYDAILSWPFTYPITLSLLNLTGAQENIIHSIVPDAQTAIFGKPTSDANTPYCIERFCPREKLLKDNNGYVCDGHMFLRFHIAFTGKTVDPLQHKGP